MTVDYNAKRRFIKARLPRLYAILPDRSRSIKGVFIHSTRSGRTDGDDGPGTENWANHPENPGAFWDMLIFENGQQVKSTNWETDEEPRWCAGAGGPGTWSAQRNYIHVEVAQGRPEDPYSAESIESLAQWIAEMARTYGFAITRIPYLSQTGKPPEGLAAHDASANGKVYGKSDPGPTFPWELLIRRINTINSEDDEMAMREELDAVKADLALYKQVLPQLVRVVLANFPADYPGEKNPLALLAEADAAGFNLRLYCDGLNAAIHKVRADAGLPPVE